MPDRSYVDMYRAADMLGLYPTHIPALVLCGVVKCYEQHDGSALFDLAEVLELMKKLPPKGKEAADATKS